MSYHAFVFQPTTVMMFDTPAIAFHVTTSLAPSPTCTCTQPQLQVRPERGGIYPKVPMLGNGELPLHSLQSRPPEFPVESTSTRRDGIGETIHRGFNSCYSKKDAARSSVRLPSVLPSSAPASQSQVAGDPATSSGARIQVSRDQSGRRHATPERLLRTPSYLTGRLRMTIIGWDDLSRCECRGKGNAHSGPGRLPSWRKVCGNEVMV